MLQEILTEQKKIASTPAAPTSGELSTEDKTSRAIASIGRLFESGHPVSVAWSGGKESTILLSLVFSAALAHRGGGGKLPMILITHANTGIENPAYQRVIDLERARIEAFIDRHDLPARIDVATPALNDTWSVAIISGRTLPTFARSATRQCSVMLKINPQERQRRKVLEQLRILGEPVVLVGTRFDESSSRAARMERRGESDQEVWTDRKFDEKTDKLISSELRLSPIARWSDEDVWMYLADLRAGRRHSYTDVADLWDAYAAGGGGGSCAVAGEEGLKANAKACGARFGCALCTSVGRDKSLESMIESDPANSYLRNLNRLQRYLVHTQGDNALRNWLGRTIDEEGFIAIEPDTYSPEMTRHLLRICLSIQEDERVAARSLGIAPRFELVSPEQLIAIDAIWSLQANQPRPFQAIAIWDEVVNLGRRTYPPAVPDEATPAFDPRPARRYLHVGNWDDGVGAFGDRRGPLFDPVAYMAGIDEARDQAFERQRLDIRARRAAGESISKQAEKALFDELEKRSFGCIGHRQTADGRHVVDLPLSPMFEVDPEAACLFLNFEAEGCLDRYYEDERASPCEAYRYYARLGMISTSAKHLSMIDNMMRRAEWKIRQGLHRMSTDEILARSISKAERASGQRHPPGAGARKKCA